MGDVTGGMQFTYIAYDDFRIVASDLLGDGSRTTKNRGAIPYCTFVHPPFARVGMTADEARKAGYSVQVYKLPAEKISQARILQDPVGLMKAVVDANSGVLLGMDLVLRRCAGAGEHRETGHGCTHSRLRAAERRIHAPVHDRGVQQPVPASEHAGVEAVVDTNLLTGSPPLTASSFVIQRSKPA